MISMFALIEKHPLNLLKNSQRKAVVGFFDARQLHKDAVREGRVEEYKRERYEKTTVLFL